MRSLSRLEVRRVDRIAIDQLGVSGLVLMENAGRGAADAIAQKWGPSISVAIVAGAGNNGGDGFVVARHLAMRGAKVATFLVAPLEKISGDAQANLAILQKLHHDIHEIPAAEMDSLGQRLRKFDVIVDAIGGTGIQGAIRGQLAAAVEQVNAAGRPIVAIDIPTGLDCDTGLASGPAIRASMTVTFVASKLGFDAPGAAQYTGDVIVADIGIDPDEVLAKV